MEPNSPKLTETGKEQLEAIDLLRGWLDRVGGNRRIPQALDLLAERTAGDLARGHPSPPLDADTLRLLHSNKHGGRPAEASASRWLSSSEVRRWWDQRQSSLEQASRQADLPVVPDLTLVSGGGRGNTTQYRLDFRPMADLEGSSEERVLLSGDGLKGRATLQYQTEPAQPTWWLRLIVGTAPFRMRSWRGVLLVGSVLAEGLVLVAFWLLALVVLREPRPITIGDLTLLLTSAGITWAWWVAVRPIIRLPLDRVTIADDWLLAWSQPHGQFQLSADAINKRAGGWFQVVRHHGTCPICSGSVDLARGGVAFPGRVVGRCSDSPLEHVFSFDPVGLEGRCLR